MTIYYKNILWFFIVHIIIGEKLHFKMKNAANAARFWLQKVKTKVILKNRNPFYYRNFQNDVAI